MEPTAQPSVGESMNKSLICTAFFVPAPRLAGNACTVQLCPSKCNKSLRLVPPMAQPSVSESIWRRMMPPFMLLATAVQVWPL